MIEVIKFGEYGITRWVDDLMKTIKENPKEFISVGRITDGDDNYSFVALFKNKCIIGKYSALLHEWGTNDDKSGEGGRGFIKMNKFLEDNNIEVRDIEINKEDAKKIGYTTATRFSRLDEWEDRVKIWQKYISELAYTL